MASLNKIILIGNVGGEPELRFTPNGKPVTSFSLATNRTYTRQDGEKEEVTTWFKVTCWNKLAETVNQFVNKGQQIYVEGRVELREWEGEDGSTRTSLEVTASQVVFLGSRKEAEEPESTGPVEELEPDDIPF